MVLRIQCSAVPLILLFKSFLGIPLSQPYPLFSLHSFMLSALFYLISILSSPLIFSRPFILWSPLILSSPYPSLFFLLSTFTNFVRITLQHLFFTLFSSFLTFLLLFFFSVFFFHFASYNIGNSPFIIYLNYSSFRFFNTFLFDFSWKILDVSDKQKNLKVWSSIWKKWRSVFLHMKEHPSPPPLLPSLLPCPSLLPPLPTHLILV